MVDGAAVLSYSIHKNSIRNPASESKYDYKLFAFVHPESSNCTAILEQLGYAALVKDTPIRRQDIRGNLKNVVEDNSSCGVKEFLKLYSYTLLDYPVVAHFDLDVVVLQPLDDLFDSMIDGPESPARARLPVMWKDIPVPKTIEGFFTRDYNTVNPGRRKVHQIGVQGGFIVIKPNQTVFDELVDIILEGNYTAVHGWGGKALSYGGYWGAGQIQGLCSYYYGHVKPNTTVELNRCIYNSMADNPKFKGTCRTLQEDCEDCRKTDFSKIKTFHLTVCQKPWGCYASKLERNGERKSVLDYNSLEYCDQFHHAWFKTRLELEYEWAKRDASYNVTPQAEDHLNLTWKESATLGFCSKDKYHRMNLPSRKIAL
jgi:hypothetical protein